MDELKELDDVLLFLSKNPDEAYNCNYIDKSVFGSPLNLNRISRILGRINDDKYIKSDHILFIRKLDQTEAQIRGFSISSA